MDNSKNNSLDKKLGDQFLEQAFLFQMQKNQINFVK